MKGFVINLVSALIIAALALSVPLVQASGGKTTFRVNLTVSRDWLSYGHIKVKKVTFKWTSSRGGMDGLFGSGGNSANFDTENFEAGLVRYSSTSATFYSGRYRDFGVSGSVGYPAECTIEHDVITYDSNKQPIVKSCCHTKSAKINNGTSFNFEWPYKM